MPLTRIQPSGIDQTLDYSVDQLTANTVVVSGVNILNSANAANNLAQAAFNAANTGTVASAAFTQANTSLVLANAAFTQANTSLDLANAAFAKANTGGTGVTSGTNNARSIINSYVFGY
jgi:hypothetical protein